MIISCSRSPDATRIMPTDSGHRRSQRRIPAAPLIDAPDHRPSDERARAAQPQTKGWFSGKSSYPENLPTPISADGFEDPQPRTGKSVPRPATKPTRAARRMILGGVLDLREKLGGRFLLRIPRRHPDYSHRFRAPQIAATDSGSPANQRPNPPRLG